jgi:hypothetical protein
MKDGATPVMKRPTDLTLANKTAVRTGEDGLDGRLRTSPWRRVCGWRNRTIVHRNEELATANLIALNGLAKVGVENVDHALAVGALLATHGVASRGTTWNRILSW